MSYEHLCITATDQATTCSRLRCVLSEGQLQAVPIWVTSCPHGWIDQPCKHPNYGNETQATASCAEESGRVSQRWFRCHSTRPALYSCGTSDTPKHVFFMTQRFIQVTVNLEAKQNCCSWLKGHGRK